MRRILFSVCLAITVGALLLCGIVHAQFDRGQISGFVKDSTGAIVAGAAVTVINEGTGQSIKVSSNDSGYYQAPNLVPGLYSVTVELAGFKKFTQTKVKLDAASRTSVDANLQVGEVTEVVEVVASTAQLQRETAQVGRVVEARQIEDLTLNGRNPMLLAGLKPGVVRGAINSFEPNALFVNFNINGSRGDENLVFYDGALASRIRSTEASLGVLNADSVQEVQILTANYNAEYGRSSGGQIRFVTKSGGRELHGGLFEFFRNSALDANAWQRNRSSNLAESRRPAPFRYSQFGYDIGGPIYIPGKVNTNRDKLFFYWSQEWIRWRREATNTGTVPSLAMRQGDFSELLNPNNPFFRTVRVIIDPMTGQPFANNVIPRERLSPNGVGLMNAFPAPVPGFQQGSANWIGTNPNPQNTRKDNIKIDYAVTSRHNLSFRFSDFQYFVVDPFRGVFDRARRTIDWPNYTSILSLTSTFDPTLINEFSVSANTDQAFINVFQGSPFQRSLYGINYPYIFPAGKEIPDKIPTIDISNFTEVDGGPYPARTSGPIYTISNNVTKIMGNHTIKFGIFIERSGQNDFDQINTLGLPGDTNNQNGRFEIRDAGHPLSTGVAIANSALGLFNSYGEIGRRSYTPWRATATDLFVQDGWKITPSLKLEYGVRYQYWPPWKSRWANIAMFHPSFYDPSRAAVVDPRGGFIVSGDRFNGIVLPGTGFPEEAKGRVDAASDPEFQRLFRGLPEGFSETHNNVLAPRLGLAFSSDPKTVIRVGVGMFHNRVTNNDSTLLGGNPPIQFKQGVTNGFVDAPGGAGSTKREFPLILTSQDPVFKHPTAWNWNLTVQRELPAATTVEVAYVGRRGYYLQRERNINQLAPGTIQANAGINADALRPFRGLGIIRLSENAANSWYHGLQIQAERRFKSGLGYGVSYTWSKSIDNASNKRNILFNSFDDRVYRAISDYNRTHVFIANYIYELPFLKDSRSALGFVLRGWEISGITQFQSGRPLSAWRRDDIAGVGPGSGEQPWNVTGSPLLPDSQRRFSNSNVDQNFWFNPTVFSRPTPGTFGNAGRNLILGPGFMNWDVGIRKNFRVSETSRIQFRAELFNFPNHPNWNNPNVDPTSGDFGRVTSKSGERNVQFALKYMF